MNQYNSEGQQHGYWEYYSYVKLSSKVEYVNGKIHGLFERYFSNGQLHIKGDVFNDIRIGFWKQYNCNGGLEVTEFIL